MPRDISNFKLLVKGNWYKIGMRKKWNNFVIKMLRFFKFRIPYAIISFFFFFNNFLRKNTRVSIGFLESMMTSWYRHWWRVGSSVRLAFNAFSRRKIDITRWCTHMMMAMQMFNLIRELIIPREWQLARPYTSSKSSCQFHDIGYESDTITHSHRKYI